MRYASQSPSVNDLTLCPVCNLNYFIIGQNSGNNLSEDELASHMYIKHKVGHVSSKVLAKCLVNTTDREERLSDVEEIAKDFLLALTNVKLVELENLQLKEKMKIMCKKVEHFWRSFNDVEEEEKGTNSEIAENLSVLYAIADAFVSTSIKEGEEDNVDTKISDGVQKMSRQVPIPKEVALEQPMTIVAGSSSPSVNHLLVQLSPKEQTTPSVSYILPQADQVDHQLLKNSENAPQGTEVATKLKKTGKNDTEENFAASESKNPEDTAKIEATIREYSSNIETSAENLEAHTRHLMATEVEDYGRKVGNCKPDSNFCELLEEKRYQSKEVTCANNIILKLPETEMVSDSEENAALAINYGPPTTVPRVVNVICKKCNKIFKTRTAFNQHAKEHHYNMFFKCKSCPKVQGTEVATKLKKTGENDTEENFTASESKNSEGTVKIEANIRKYSSKIETLAENPEAHAKHLMAADVEYYGRKVENCKPDSNFCELLEEKRSQSKEVTCANNIILKLPESEMVSDSEEDTALAIDYGPPTTVPRVMNVICKKCNKGFKTRKAFNQHVKEHDYNMFFNCKSCPKVFTNAATLMVHEKIHRGDVKQKKCSHCKYMTQNQLGMLKHMRSKHTKEKLFPCRICSQTFSTYVARETHRRKHNDSSKEYCKKCSRFYGKTVDHKCK